MDTRDCPEPVGVMEERFSARLEGPVPAGANAGGMLVRDTSVILSVWVRSKPCAMKQQARAATNKEMSARSTS